MRHAPCAGFLLAPGRGLRLATVLPTSVGPLFSGANAGSAFSRAPAEVEPLEVRFAHPVRLSPATHSQGHGRPCLQRLHLRRGFSLHRVFPDVFFVTGASLHQILAFHLMGWRDAATLRFCKGLICKGLSKRGVEMWPKNGCVSTLLLNCYLIINELRIYLWPRPDWRLGC